MLVLSRGCGSEIYIGPEITIRVLEIHKRQVKLGIEAPNAFSIWRGELITDGNRDDSVSSCVPEDSIMFARLHPL